MIRKALFLASFMIVPRNGLLLADLAVAALGEGGVGGREERTPPTVSKNPGMAGKNQTRLRRGTWDGFDIIRGVISCPSTSPSGLDIPRMRVARVLSVSPNQFWLTYQQEWLSFWYFSVHLTLVGTQDMKGQPMPVSACPTTVSLKEKLVLHHAWPPHTPGRVAKQQKEPPTAVSQAPTSRPNLRPFLSTTYTARRQKGMQRP